MMPAVPPSSCKRKDGGWIGGSLSLSAAVAASGARLPARTPQEVDTTWRELMESARANPGCLVLAAQQERLAALELNNRLLDEVQKVSGGRAGLLKVAHRQHQLAGSRRSV